MSSREQKLIDIMFEVMIGMHQGDFRFDDREQAGEWLKNQLNQCDFKGGPIGSSWFRLEE